MRRGLALIVVGLALLGILPGCNKHLKTAHGMSESTAAVKVLRLRWVKKLAPTVPNFLVPEMGEEHDRFNPIETSAAAFDTDKQRAFIGSSVGGLYCLDVHRGETVWRFELDDPVGSIPLFDPSRKYVYFGADDGKLYAVHARSGRLIWSLDTKAEIRRKAHMFNDTLYFVNANSTVFAVDPVNGEIVWQYRRPPIEGFSSAGHAGLRMAGDKIITGFSDGYIVALDAIVGTEIWHIDLASEVTRVSVDGVIKLTDSDATPVIADGVLVAASIDGGLQGINVNTGNMLWTAPEISHVTGLATSNGVVYAARSAFGLTAVSPRTGQVIWSKQFLAGTLLDPLVYQDLLLISDSEFGLYVVSAIDGSLLQKLNQYEGFLARPSMHAGYLFVLGNSGTLYAMSIL